MTAKRPWWWWVVPLTAWMNRLADRLEAHNAATRARAKARRAAILRAAGLTEDEL